MKDVLSLERPDMSEGVAALASQASLISQEEDKVIDTRVQTAFLQIFASLMRDVMIKKTRIDLKKIVPYFHHFLMKNPSLIEIADRLSRQYHFIPPNLMDIRRPLTNYFQTNIPDEWIQLLNDHFRAPAIDLEHLDLLQEHLRTPLHETQGQEIVALVSRTVPPADTVHLINNSLSVRRLDSLARLLAIDKDLSVCTSVSFMNRKVIIGSNNSIDSRDKAGELICETLINRFISIRTFIQSIHQKFDLHDLFDLYNPETERYQPHYEALLHEFFHQLKTDLGGTQFENATLFQAMTKLIYSSMEHLPKEFCLRDEDRRCLLDSSDIVALTVTPRSSLSFTIPHSEKSQVWLLMAKINTRASVEDGQQPQYQYLPLNERNEGYLSKFHAEQLNALYYLNLDEPHSSELHEIGVSKLCCPKCHQVLSGRPCFTYRGNHYSAKRNIVDVLAAMPSQIRFYEASSEVMESSFSSASSESSPLKKNLGSMASLEHSFESAEGGAPHSFSDLSSPRSVTELMRRKSPVKNFFDEQAVLSEAMLLSFSPADAACESPIKKTRKTLTLADQSPFLSPGLKNFLTSSQQPLPSFKACLSFESES